MRSLQTNVPAWCSLALLFSVVGCGSTSFTSNSPAGGAAAATKSATTATTSKTASSSTGTVNSADAANAGSEHLTWNWPCASAASGSTTAAPAASTITGPGAHTVAAPSTGSNLVIEGQLCQPASLPRDVLFVIDVSGSMAQNDPSPFFSTSCGRLTAIQTVMASIPAGNAQYAILTFDSSVEASSSAMFPTQAALFNDIDNGGNISSIICSHGSDTNYEAALTTANTILSKGRANATKEIYFVSDGEPTSGEEGMAQAQALTGTGVTVGTSTIKVTLATVMLNGTGASTEIAMSSLGPNGQPLHADVANAASLATALTTLSSNGIASASLEYRATGTSAYTTANLMTTLSGANFALPAMAINTGSDPKGLDVILQYTDQRGNQYTSQGNLAW